MIDDFLKKVKSLFFRKIKIQKIFSKILKFFFILKFTKKICDIFFRQKLFSDIFFWRKKFLAFLTDLDIFLNTHTQFFKKILDFSAEKIKP
jgi:hypothetical protein